MTLDKLFTLCVLHGHLDKMGTDEFIRVNCLEQYLPLGESYINIKETLPKLKKFKEL